MAANKPILDPVASKGKTLQAKTDIDATTCAASGNNTIVAAPGAGFRLVVIDFVIQNESATETTVLIRSGSTNKRRGKLVANASSSMNFSEGREWRLGENEALIVNLSGANSHGYSGTYFIEPV